MKTTLGLCAVAAFGLLGYLAVSNRSTTLHLAAEIARDMNAARAKVLQTLHPQDKPIENALSGELKNIEMKMKKLEDKASSTSDEEFARSSFPGGRESAYKSLPIDVLANKVVDRIIEQYLSGILPFTLDKPDTILQPAFSSAGASSKETATNSQNTTAFTPKEVTPNIREVTSNIKDAAFNIKEVTSNIRDPVRAEKKHKVHHPVIPTPVKPRISEQSKTAASPVTSQLSAMEEEAANENAIPAHPQDMIRTEKSTSKLPDSISVTAQAAMSEDHQQETPAVPEQTTEYNETE